MKASLLSAGLLAVLAGLSLTPSLRAQEPDPGNILPVITLHTPDGAASEAGDPGRFVLVRQGPTNLPVHVFVRIGGTASNGVDYAAIPNWIGIPAGVREVGIPVTPLVDSEVEGPETVALKLVPSPVLPPTAYAIGTPNEGVVIISENATNPPPPNVPVVTVRAVDPEAVEPAEIGAPPNLGIFQLRRDGNTNDQLNVLYTLRGTASNGVDYVERSGVAVVPAGRREAGIEIIPRFDQLAEGVETVVLRLADVVWPAVFPPPPGCYAVGTPREAVVFIADNDQPTNRPPLARIVRPFDGQLFFAPVNVPIRVETVDPDGYVPRVEFFANNIKIGVRERMFPVPPPPGEPIPYEFVWTNAPVGRPVLTVRATDNRGAHSMSPPVRIWVAETNPPDALPRVSIIAADPVAAEGTNCLHWPGVTNTTSLSNASFINPAHFVVRRTGPTNEPLAVRYLVGGTASNGVDYLELPGVATIPAGRRAAEIRVIPIDDALAERTETVVLSLRLPPEVTAVVPPYLPAWPARAAAIIVDNDSPRPPHGMLDDRLFHLALSGEPGRWFRVECSNDGRHWLPVGSVQVLDGALHFVDPDADELPARLYRVVPVDAPPAD